MSNEWVSIDEAPIKGIWAPVWISTDDEDDLWFGFVQKGRKVTDVEQDPILGVTHFMRVEPPKI